jgi:type II secretory pathway component PulK
MRLYQHQRSGVILLTVLIVLAVLLLVGYQYLNLMTAEGNASVVSGKVTQARYLADSGVHYASFVLAYPQTAGISDSDDSFRIWPGYIYDNTDLFQARPINGPNGIKGYFSIVSRRDPAIDPNASTSGYRFGIEDENAKINLNAIRKLLSGKSTPPTLLSTITGMLQNIPNFDSDKANAVINWTQTGGTPDSTEAGYYSSLNYNSKAGPYDTTEELLLVKGWTPRLLYGNDRNRNGTLEPDEDDGTGQIDFGFQKYFTSYSREMNVDSTGQPRININDSNLQNLKTQLDTAFNDPNITAFLLLGRAVDLSKRQTVPLPRGFTITGGRLQINNASNLTASQSIASLWDIVDNVQSLEETIGARRITSSITSPFQSSNLETLRPILATLFDKFSLTGDSEIPARININTAPVELLSATPLNPTDVQNIIDHQPSPNTDPSTLQYYRTPAWLLTEAGVSMSTINALNTGGLMDKLFTTYSQVYRFQVVGYFDQKGPQVRLEVVVDANNGRPRILHWRDLTDLGKGYNFSQGGSFSP